MLIPLKLRESTTIIVTKLVPIILPIQIRLPILLHTNKIIKLVPLILREYIKIIAKKLVPTDMIIHTTTHNKTIMLVPLILQESTEKIATIQN